MAENTKELNLEELEKVNGGVLYGYDATPSERAERARKAAQLKEMREREVEAQNTADIRMRAAEDALRAAMRLDAQERAIKEQVAANRIELD